MTLEKPLRLALIGTGHPHSLPYQVLLKNLPEVDVVAVYDDGGEVIEENRSLPVYHNLDKLIASERFDAALVTVPNERGLECVLPLVDAGKHVLADKPVCRNGAEMRRILSRVEARGVRFAAGYQNRFQPAHERARALVRSGALGELFAVQGHLFTTDVHARGPEHFLFRKDVSGGGILHWLGCHVLDLMLDLIPSEPVDVSGHVSTLSGTGIDVEDVGGFSVRFANGVVGTLLAGYTIPFETDSPYVESPKDTALTLWGSRGRITYEPMGTQGSESWYQAQGERPVREARSFALPPFPGYTGWLGKRMIEDFAASIAEGRPPRAGAKDNLKVLNVLDAVYHERNKDGV